MLHGIKDISQLVTKFSARGLEEGSYYTSCHFTQF